MIADLKPYPAYKNSGVPWLGEIPAHWEVLPLKRLGWFKSGAGFPIEQQGQQDLELPFFKVSDMNLRGNSRIMSVWNNSVSRSTAFSLGATVFPPRTIVFPKVGGAMLTNKRRIVERECCIDNNLMGCVVKRCDQDFAMLLLQHLDFAAITKPGPVPAISEGEVREIRVVLPPLSEQHAITRYLDHVDRRIRRYIRAKQKLIALLEEQKQAIIHQAVTRGLDPTVRLKPSGVAWLGDVPERWERFRLKTLLKSVDRRSIDGEQPLLSLRRDHGIVRYDEHFARPPQAATTIGYKIVEVGQIVVNRLQANNGLIFRAGIEGLVSPDYSVFYARDYADPEFLARLIRTSVYKAHFRRVATGLGTGTAGFLRLYDDDLLDTLVYLPPIEQQLAIVEFLDQSTADTNSAIARTEHEIALLREYRTRLITDVVTGQVDVREAAAGLPAEVEEPLATDDDEALGEEIEEDDMDLVDEEEG